MIAKPPNLFSLKEVLKTAEKGRYAIGSFSPRYTPMILPVLRAACSARAAVIVQISQKELTRYRITPGQFATEFYTRLGKESIDVPVVLHLDHTKEFSIIEDAIAAGFTSVMIDASEKSLEENIRISKDVTDFAHQSGVSVEAELGRIGAADLVETDSDEELYTVPEEAQEFVAKTGVDALAVSVGTAHGVYNVRQPRVDYARLERIRQLTPVPLVLHGGSGVPAEMVIRAIQLPGGGISKVNIATDLEQAFLQAIGREEYMTDEECRNLSLELLTLGQRAVEHSVTDKILNFLKGEGSAHDFK